MQILFTPYMKKNNDEYFGKVYKNKDIKIVKNLTNVELRKKYLVEGTLIGEVFEAEKSIEYIEVIGTITSLKSLKDNKSLAKVKTLDGKIFSAEVNNFYTELNEEHIFKGVFEKNILKTDFAKKLETKKVIIKENASENIEKYNTFLRAELAENTIATKEKVFLIGNFSLLYKEDIVEVYGYQDGNYFYVMRYDRDKYSDTKMISSFLNKTFKKTVTPSMTRNFINKYGLETISKLEDPKIIMQDFPKLKEELCLKISKKILAAKYVQEFFYFCQKKGISVDVAEFIFNQYGAASLDKLKTNPYLIVEAKPSLFYEAEVFGEELKFEPNNQNRIVAAIRYLLYLDSEFNGNVFTYKDDLLNNLNPLMQQMNIYKDSFVAKEDVLEALKTLEEFEVIKIDEDRVYFLYNYVYEKESSRLLSKLLNDFKTPFCKRIQIEDAIKTFESNYTTLDEKQKDAIFQAILSNISILTGGPGTGKTLTVNAILKTILSINNNAKVKLCAPTGRASKRIMEVTSYEATTIHKLLNINSYGTITKEDEIPQSMQNLDYLIIDEFSMVDIKLFYEILICLDEKTRLIIIGDHNQLPSVGPGQILKDLIESEIVPTVELTKIFRQSKISNIVTLAHQIIKNMNISLNDYYISNLKDILTKDVSFVETLSIQQTKEMVYEVIKILFDDGLNFNHIQILSPMNKGEIGTNAINNEIQRIYNGNIFDSEKFVINSNLYISKGDKVIQTVNNYSPSIEVMNGTIGYVEQVLLMDNPNLVEKIKEDTVVINFDDEDKDFMGKDIYDVKLAYDITIHKSQGSEFPIVILPLDMSQKVMLNKNLLYTAITRAKEKLIIVGSEVAFYQALQSLVRERNSNLKSYFITFSSK